MNKFLNLVMDRLTDLALPLAMLLAALVPTLVLSPAAAWADESSQLDLSRRNGGRGGEGDPLDTNDADGEGDPDEDVQNSNSNWGGSTWGGSVGRDLGRISPTTRFLLVPRYNGKALSFEVIIMNAEGKILRRSHAR